MSADADPKREIRVAIPRIAPFVAARGRRTMVITVPRGSPHPVQGVVFADEAVTYATAVGEVIQTRGRG